MPFNALESTIDIKSSCLSLVVRPDLGGRISSIRDRRSGREWLWKNPWISPRPARAMESYIRCLDAGGWDDILPSVAACEISGGPSVPDHGDVVRLAAEVVSADDAHCVLKTDLRSIQACFTRSLQLDGSCLTIRYRLESLSEREQPWLWAAHPLFALEPGSVITGIRGDDFHLAEAIGTSPETWAVIPDFRARGFQPFACKRFSRPGAVDAVGLQHPDGSSLRLEWNRSVIPHLGIWLNVGAWSGCDSPPYVNLGLEPTTSPCDSLALAVQEGNAMILPPGKTLCWELRILWNSPHTRS